MRLKFLKKKFVISIFQQVIYFYLWLVFKTCRKQLKITPSFAKSLSRKTPSFIYFWHGRISVCSFFLLQYAKLYRGLTTSVVSSSMDGDIIAGIIHKMGQHTVRGSSRKNKFTAMKGIIQALRNNHTVGVAIDGPKGPAYLAKKATIELAQRYQAPIYCVCFSATASFKLNTWDNMILPTPFVSKLFIEVRNPIYLASEEDNFNLINKILNDQMEKLDRLSAKKVK